LELLARHAAVLFIEVVMRQERLHL
jgi:hypothetical protein